MNFTIQKETLAKELTDLTVRLEEAIVNCPDSIWDSDSKNPRYWYLVYHTLFFVDLHLSDSPKGFRPPDPFAIIGIDFSGKNRVPAYSKEQLLRYVVHVRKKSTSKAESLTESGIRKRCGFPWLNLDVEELLLYTIKNVSAYIVQLRALLDND
jgi:hypothetical protein